ncbi:MAG: alginate lyase family protein [Candidatus Latescibacteria bacterium]|jgi:hypothetical protein|nr:alginate lyase family protein [Candidatus Latescibacterota bacterium]MBT4137793.1 alginate lyase family protein [Candidatus Latescibacterota bacterium]
MRFFTQSHIDIATLDRERILRNAQKTLTQSPLHITDAPAPMSEGGPNDFYSNGDYWWPNSDTPDGLPYIRRDGESNPGAFLEHRRMMRAVRTTVSALTAAYQITKEEKYAQHAVQWLVEFLVDKTTRMNPNMLYAQAIPGICSGRSIGLIDTLHIVEIPLAIHHLKSSHALTPEIEQNLITWFADFLTWMTTHPYGIQEMEAHNNHGVAWAVQAAMFAQFTKRDDVMDQCRTRFKTVFLPEQMAENGSFPAELARTKPYGYSIFQLDMMAMLTYTLSTSSENLWTFTTPNGRGMQHALEYLFPFLEDKSRWPLPPDVQHFSEWPVRQPALLFGGLALGEQKYLDLWQRLDADPTDDEIRRNLAIRQPLLWV